MLSSRTLDFHNRYVSYYPMVEKIMYDIVEDGGKYMTIDEMIQAVQEERPEVKEEKIRHVLRKWEESGRMMRWS